MYSRAETGGSRGRAGYGVGAVFVVRELLGSHVSPQARLHYTEYSLDRCLHRGEPCHQHRSTPNVSKCLFGGVQEQRKIATISHVVGSEASAPPFESVFPQSIERGQCLSVDTRCRERVKEEKGRTAFLL